MIRIEYCKEGSPVSDFELDREMHTLALCIDDPGIKIVQHSTHNYFTAVCREVLHERLDPQKLIFVRDGREYPVREYMTLLAIGLATHKCARKSS